MNKEEGSQKLISSVSEYSLITKVKNTEELKFENSSPCDTNSSVFPNRKKKSKFTDVKKCFIKLIENDSVHNEENSNERPNDQRLNFFVKLSQKASENENQSSVLSNFKNHIKEQKTIETLTDFHQVRDEGVKITEFGNFLIELISFGDFQNFIDKICEDKNFSKKIQDLLETSLEKECDLFIERIYDHVESLFDNVYGNYLLQKLIKTSFYYLKLEFPKVIKSLTVIVSKNFLRYSKSPFSSRTIQTIVEVICQDANNYTTEKNTIINSLKGISKDIIQDKYGNHFIRKLVHLFDEDYLDPIIIEIFGNLSFLVDHCYGSRIIQDIIEKFARKSTIGVKLIENYVIKNVMELSVLQNANYVVQQIICSSDDEIKVPILKVLVDNFTILSLNKFGRFIKDYSSNVTQESLKLPCKSYLTYITHNLIKNSYEAANYKNTEIFSLLMSNYGNYVLQSLFQNNNEESKNKILRFFIANPIYLIEAKKNKHGRYFAKIIENSINKE